MGYDSYNFDGIRRQVRKNERSKRIQAAYGNLTTEQLESQIALLRHIELQRQQNAPPTIAELERLLLRRRMATK
jgi:hypothetical protein